MYRSTMKHLDRLARAMLLSSTLAQLACYGPGKTYTKSTSFKVVDAKPVQVASRLDVALRGQDLFVTETPFCAPAKTGEYVVVEESRSQRKTSRGEAFMALLLGVGGIVASSYVLDESEELGSLLLLGGLMAGTYGGTMMLLPDTVTSEDEPAKYRAATLASGATWHACADARPVATELRMDISGGTTRFATVKATRADGLLALPADLQTWASACRIDVKVVVSLPKHAGVAPDTILEEREKAANIDHKGFEHTAIAIRERLSPQFDQTQIELGEYSGMTGSVGYATRASWTFDFLKDGSNGATAPLPKGAGSGLSKLARECIRRDCMEPERAAVEKECRSTCKSEKPATGTSDGKSSTSCQVRCEERLFEVACPR